MNTRKLKNWGTGSATFSKRLKRFSKRFPERVL